MYMSKDARIKVISKLLVTMTVHVHTNIIVYGHVLELLYVSLQSSS